ncbi:MarR family winged helix-turn-helix transcriptional regulator [Streptomyces sp. NPDC056105]|uniref:MarR family winged helix-turn-helix transcriptional regulator n=1 Tax=Streptomyces sp. NPDC056105 TaxID=3345714 RepID=UPI0035DEDDE2
MTDDASTDPLPAAASQVQGADFGDAALELTRRELPDIDGAAFQLGMLLLRTANMHGQQSERLAHRPHGFSTSGFRVLYIVWIFQRAEARDIARLAGMSRQSASSVLATLEGDGLVIRERLSSTDRRLVSVRLSDTGHEAIMEAFARQNALEKEWFADLSVEEQLVLKGLLNRVASKISQSARQPTDT